MREIDTGAQEAFINEVNEDLKNESMKKLWDKYGLYIIILVAAALTAAVSFETIKAWHTQKIQKWSDSYAYALSLQNQGKYEDSIQTFDYIAGQDYGIFSDLAQMQKANILLEQNKTDEALQLMAEIAADNSFNSQLRDTVALKLASYKLENAPVDEIRQLIGSIAQDAENSWQPVANEMLALAYLRDGEIAQAREIYDRLLQSDKTSEVMKVRIKDILSALPQ